MLKKCSLTKLEEFIVSGLIIDVGVENSSCKEQNSDSG